MKMLNRFVPWIILASATLTIMASTIIAPVLNLIREGLNVDPASVGFIIAILGFFVALFSPLVGAVIDRIGTKKPFLFGLVLYGLAGGSGLFINSYWLLIISRAFMGIAVAAIITSAAVMVLDLYQGAERDKFMGWRGSAVILGGIVWLLVGGFLGRFSWHLPFAVYFLSIPIAFVALTTIPETRREKIQETGGDSSVLKVFRSNPVFFAIYGLVFLMVVLLYAIIVFLPQLLEKIGISSPFHISLFIATWSLAAGLASFMYGKIKSRLSYKTIVLIALVLLPVGFITISQTFSDWLIVVAVALVGIGMGMVMPAVVAWIDEIMPVSFRGRIVSYFGTFAFGGQFLSPIIFAPVVLLLGLSGVFMVAAIASALAFFLFLTALIPKSNRPS